MGRGVALLLAAFTFALPFASLLIAAPAGAGPVDFGPHFMLPNPDLYPTIPFPQRPGWTGTPPGTRGGGTRATGNENVIVILVEFNDDTATTAASTVGNLMNDASPGAASARNYYDEISYGMFGITATVTQWYVTGDPKSMYGADSGSGYDDLNGPIYRLVVEAVQLADGAVNFANFDADGTGATDGVVNHVIVVHSGDAQESSGNSGDIWSHRWSVVDANPGAPGSQPLMADGVQIYGYIMVSESSPVGVVVHELGHDLGLPDLYDTDGTSDGIGVWDVMGTGSWNGAPRGSRPAHMSAWSKIQVGWINPVVVGGALLGESIPNAETNPRAYKLPIRTVGAQEEYFLVENRNRIGFDQGLPSEGLLIWHVDTTVSGNEDDGHRLVDLEEADNNDSPTQPGDTWASTVDGFGPETSPNSNSNLNQRTGWKVRLISAAGSAMTADLSREVNDDLLILGITRDCCVSVGTPADVNVTVGNRGAREQTNAVLNLSVYAGAIGPGTRVCCTPRAITSLARGDVVNLTFSAPTTTVGKYILEASIPLALDEIPENNVMFAHFNAATYAFFDDGEGGNPGWAMNGGPLDPVAWAINGTESHSPTNSWRYGRVGAGPCVPPLCPAFHNLSQTVPNVSGTLYLYFWHRFDLRGRGIDMSTGRVETDVGYLNVSVDGTQRFSRQYADAQLEWRPVQLNLTPYAIGLVDVTIEFSASARYLQDSGGWWVDDIGIANAPLLPGLVARAVTTEAVADPGGLAAFRFKVANVGDFDDEFEFALQPPTGWDAGIGENATFLYPWNLYRVRLRPDAEAVLFLVLSVAVDAPRGSRWVVPVTATSVTNTSVEATFDTLTIVNDPFGLAGLEKYLFLFLIVFAAVIVIAVIIDAVKKQKGVYRRW